MSDNWNPDSVLARFEKIDKPTTIRMIVNNADKAITNIRQNFCDQIALLNAKPYNPVKPIANTAVLNISIVPSDKSEIMVIANRTPHTLNIIFQLLIFTTSINT